MTRGGYGDRNRPRKIIDHYLPGDRIMIYARYPGRLMTGRWAYRDNPWNGLDEKEHANHFRLFENKSPRERRG